MNSVNNDLQQSTASRPAGVEELGTLLKRARAERGLELPDIAELTHVRREYLRALEEGRFQDLPEDVYTRNFVKLYAQAVGIASDHALEVYQRDRQRAGGLSTIEERLDKERRGEPPPKPTRSPRTRRSFQLNPVIPTMLLVVGLVALAVWGYNALFFKSGRQVATPPAGGTSQSAAPAGTQAAELPAGVGSLAQPQASNQASSLQAPGGTVLFDVTTNPPGASVSVDSFMLPGVTPIVAAPITALPNRTVRVTLDGYEPVTQVVDLSQATALTITLSPQAAAPQTTEQPATTAVGASEIAINVKATSWLEVYRGNARNSGERLVYTTASPGQTYRFTLPVYVHAGNAAGVEIAVGDQAPIAMGSAGAVVGRAFEAR